MLRPGFDEDEAADQIRSFGGDQQSRVAAERVTNEDDRCEVELLHQKHDIVDVGTARNVDR